VLGSVGPCVNEGGAILVAEPDAGLAARDPAVLASERRRRFTAETLEDALGQAGLVVTGWPARGAGLLVARAVAADAAALVAALRREIEVLEARVGNVVRLEQEREALEARVAALEARDAELRERLLSAHELLGERDTEVVRLVDADRELRQVKGTVLFRAGQRYWRAKSVARRAAGKLRRELSG
jgi:hypothetical protein